ncbi:MAG TPA: ATP-binding protein [Myxococcota bacterium]|nr:ATP-binding protein [Myxococcota bacterium]
MDLRLLQLIHQQNPWLKDKGAKILAMPNFRPRAQIATLMLPEWDRLCTILTGPRRAGKTTLGKYLSEQLLAQKRFHELLYINCDLWEIRQWLTSSLFIQEAQAELNLKKPIVLIDEVQRLESPGLFLKMLADLALPIKILASGSSQLEIKSKVTEHLTGRNFSSLVLPLSFSEWPASSHIDDLLLYGSYPQIIDTQEKELLLGFLFQDYINKDIIETLKLGNADVFLKLMSLVAHSSGQLANYNQLATDCNVSVTMIKHYLSIAKQTYIIAEVTPFVGNKRVELTSNPIFYFIDNGIRNYALRNFSAPNTRTDLGLLVEGLVFQELYKLVTQSFLNYQIHYWRTKSGAEVDFVVYKNDQALLPIEVKFQNMKAPKVTRGFRSFLQAYQPKNAVVITKDLIDTITVSESRIYFIPLTMFERVVPLVITL